MVRLSILIPVYNEENTLAKLIELVKAADIGNIEKEIIVVNDGSNDGTLDILRQMRGIKLVSHPYNMGKGMAIRTAIKHSTGDIILIQDADLEYDPNDYRALITPILNGEAKVVYGSRWLEGKKPRSASLSFYLGGIFLTHLTNFLYPSARISDEATCYKVFRSDVIKNIHLTCRRFEFCPEITAKVAKKDIRIKEAAISYFPRSIKGGKKIRWKDGVEAIWTLVKYRFYDD